MHCYAYGCAFMPHDRAAALKGDLEVERPDEASHRARCCRSDARAGDRRLEGAGRVELSHEEFGGGGGGGQRVHVHLPTERAR
jgi:hypothetical protein